jgi:hypothetical protein
LNQSQRPPLYKDYHLSSYLETFITSMTSEQCPSFNNGLYFGVLRVVIVYKFDLISLTQLKLKNSRHKSDLKIWIFFPGDESEESGKEAWHIIVGGKNAGEELTSGSYFSAPKVYFDQNLVTFE